MADQCQDGNNHSMDHHQNTSNYNNMDDVMNSLQSFHIGDSHVKGVTNQDNVFQLGTRPQEHQSSHQNQEGVDVSQNGDQRRRQRSRDRQDNQRQYSEQHEVRTPRDLSESRRRHHRSSLENLSQGDVESRRQRNHRSSLENLSQGDVEPRRQRNHRSSLENLSQGEVEPRRQRSHRSSLENLSQGESGMNRQSHNDFNVNNSNMHASNESNAQDPSSHRSRRRFITRDNDDINKTNPQMTAASHTVPVIDSSRNSHVRQLAVNDNVMHPVSLLPSKPIIFPNKTTDSLPSANQSDSNSDTMSDKERRRQQRRQRAQSADRSRSNRLSTAPIVSPESTFVTPTDVKIPFDGQTSSPQCDESLHPNTQNHIHSHRSPRPQSPRGQINELRNSTENLSINSQPERTTYKLLRTRQTSEGDSNTQHDDRNTSSNNLHSKHGENNGVIGKDFSNVDFNEAYHEQRDPRLIYRSDGSVTDPQRIGSTSDVLISPESPVNSQNTQQRVGPQTPSSFMKSGNACPKPYSPPFKSTAGQIPLSMSTWLSLSGGDSNLPSNPQPNQQNFTPLRDPEHELQSPDNAQFPQDPNIVLSHSPRPGSPSLDRSFELRRSPRTGSGTRSPSPSRNSRSELLQSPVTISGSGTPSLHPHQAHHGSRENLQIPLQDVHQNQSPRSPTVMHCTQSPFRVSDKAMNLSNEQSRARHNSGSSLKSQSLDDTGQPDRQRHNSGSTPKSLSSDPVGKLHSPKEQLPVSKSTEFPYTPGTPGFKNQSALKRAPLVTDLDKAAQQIDSQRLQKLFTSADGRLPGYSSSDLDSPVSPMVSNQSNEDSEMETDLDTNDSHPAKFRTPRKSSSSDVSTPKRGGFLQSLKDDVANLQQKVASRKQKTSSDGSFIETPRGKTGSDSSFSETPRGKDSYRPNVNLEDAVRWPRSVPGKLDFRHMEVFEGKPLIKSRKNNLISSIFPQRITCLINLICRFIFKNSKYNICQLNILSIEGDSICCFRKLINFEKVYKVRIEKT